MHLLFFLVPSTLPSASGYGYNASSIYVDWEEIPLSRRNGILRGYRVFYNYVLKNTNTLGETYTVDVNDTEVTQLILTGLIRDSEYNVSVAGFTRVGIGRRSEVIKIPTGIYG